MNLSKNLTIAEFEASPTATRLGIENKMNDEQLENARLVAEKIFQPLREYRGKPIRLNSGFRSEKLNKKIGGSTTSQHSKGQAIDVPLTAQEFHWVKDNLPFDQLIAEFPVNGNPQWVHISYSKSQQRKQVLVAKKVNGKTKYFKYKDVKDLY